MDLFANLATGFAVALTPANLGFCFLGALIGTLVGVLPGIARSQQSRSCCRSRFRCRRRRR